MANVFEDILKTDKYIFFDLESDGLLEDGPKGARLTKIWCAGWWHPKFGDQVQTSTDMEEIAKVVTEVDYIFCHNGIMFDSFVLEEFCGVDIKHKIVDTLALSWYLCPERFDHGLGNWGKELEIKKPLIEDWATQGMEVYLDRVTEDVKIQAKLSNRLLMHLRLLYEEQGLDKCMEIIDLLNSILLVYHEQRENPFDLNVALVGMNLDILNERVESKIEALKKVMPMVPIKVDKQKPMVPFKKDGSLSKNGERWFAFLKEVGAPSDVNRVTYISEYKEPNPSSTSQLKDWLFSLGWSPKIFKISKTQQFPEGRKVPQVMTDNKELCPSVVEMAEIHPEILELKDLSVLKHRVGILNGFINNVDSNGKIYGEIAGFTNTLRSRHRKIVNLPKISAEFGEMIRPSLMVGKYSGEYLMGADIVSLENFTRTCLIADIDPGAITELLDPEFDTHLDLGLTTKMVSEDDINFYKDIKKRIKDEDNTITTEELDEYHRLDKLRDVLKTTNYACLYNAGIPALTASLKCTTAFATMLHSSYWIKNKAVKERAEQAPTKIVLGTRWIYNDIVGVWFECRSDHTRFSTLNQGMGSVIFYNWVRECRGRGIKITLNMHDEIQVRCKKDRVDEYQKIMEESMDVVNKKFNLIVPIRISVNVGSNYGETH